MLKRIFVIAQSFLMAVAAEAQTEKIWTLDECIHYAEEHNLDVRKQSLSSEKSRLALQEGKWAFAPRLSASSSYTMSTGRVLDPTTYEFVKTNYTGNASTSVSGEMSIFEGGRKIHALSRAKLAKDATLLDDESLRYNLRIQVITLYMDVLCAREQQRIAENTRSLVEHQLEKTKALYDAGSVIETDVLQLQAQLSAAQKDLVSAVHAHEMSKLSLCEVLEWDNYLSLEVADPDEADLAQVQADFHAMLDGHPDVRSSVLRKDLAATDYKIALSSMSPKLSLSAGYGTSYSDARKKAIINEDGTLKYEAYPFLQQYIDNGSAFISLSLSIPILNGMNTRNSIRRARIAKTEAELDAVATRKKVLKQILKARMDYLSAHEQYLHAQENLRYAEEVFSQVERKYNLGATDYLTWNTAAVELAKARYVHAEAKYMYFLQAEVIKNM